MLNTELLAEVHGIISTGKEANVYHAVAGQHEKQTGEEYAVKIFKTTLNEFKNRSDYVEGEFRFRRASLQNPRKLIKLWAEKEMRNLKRLTAAQVPCPTPIVQKENILVMSFIGKEGFPAPALKDATFNHSKLKACYYEVIKLMRQMFHGCKLVHGDLSEYNILYWQGKVWIIDVSQAVEHDHPRALEFLKRDCLAISAFFTKKGLANCFTARQLFEFTTKRIKEEDVDKYIHEVEERNETMGDKELTAEEIIAEGVFQNSFIPRTLHQVQHPTNELFDGSAVLHSTVTGVYDDDDYDDDEEYDDEEYDEEGESSEEIDE